MVFDILLVTSGCQGDVTNEALNINHMSLLENVCMLAETPTTLEKLTRNGTPEKNRTRITYLKCHKRH